MPYRLIMTVHENCVTLEKHELGGGLCVASLGVNVDLFGVCADEQLIVGAGGVWGLIVHECDENANRYTSNGPGIGTHSLILRFFFLLAHLF